MKYFTRLEDEFINKPFLIDEPNLERCIDIDLDVPDEYLLKYSSLFARLNNLNKQLTFISLGQRAKE